MREEDTAASEDTERRASKSARKREMQALQALGERLATMKGDELADLPLTEAFRAALAEGARTKGREAQRRHRQYLGRLMRTEDGNAIAAALAAREQATQRAARLHHQVERERQALLAGDVELAVRLRQADEQLTDAKLQGLCEAAAGAPDPRAKRRASRELYRRIAALHDAAGS